MDEQTRLVLLAYESLDDVTSNNIQRAEAAARLTEEGEEFSARGQLAEGRMSLAEPGTYLCPAPHTDEFFAQFLKRKRLELTEKYQHLVTRQMLRDSRWLTYTVALLKDLVEEEAQLRQEIYVESIIAIPSFSCRHLQLQMISARGTEGTFIHVEEVEREVRYRVVVFQEVQERDALLENESLHRLDAARATSERLAAEADARGCVEAAEWNARWLVEREEENAFEPIPRLAAPNAHRIFEISLWRVMTLESEARHLLECEEEKELYPHAQVKRSPWDDDESESSAPRAVKAETVSANPVPVALIEPTTLADFVQRHEQLCSSLQLEQRELRRDRAEAQHLAAAAFLVNHPVARDKYADQDDERIAAIVDAQRKRLAGNVTRGGDVSSNEGELRAPQENAENSGTDVALLPSDEPLILYGYTFTQVPAVRRAGQEPEFVPPPPCTGTATSPVASSVAVTFSGKAHPTCSAEGSCGVSPEHGSDAGPVSSGLQHHHSLPPDEEDGAGCTTNTVCRDSSDDDNGGNEEEMSMQNWSREAAWAKKLEIERLWAELNDLAAPHV